MPTNLEIKAKIPNIRDAKTIARSISAKYAGDMYQIDTYFNIPYGRLKIRYIKNSHAELIYYNREENSVHRMSRFDVFSTKEPAILIKILRNAFGIKAVVRKKRILFLYENTRIHLDSVIGLGSFIEFEVPMKTKITALKRLKYLSQVFKIREEDYLKVSYLDLIGSRSKRRLNRR
jgi:adenylate cyclase, class 2